MQDAKSAVLYYELVAQLPSATISITYQASQKDRFPQIGEPTP
jgi:hypothetical protein